MIKTARKRGLSLLLVICMLIGMLPTVLLQAAAADDLEYQYVWLISKPGFRYEYRTDGTMWFYTRDDPDNIVKLQCKQEGGYWVIDPAKAPPAYVDPENPDGAAYLELTSNYNNKTIPAVPNWNGSEFTYQTKWSRPFDISAINESNKATYHWGGNIQGKYFCNVSDNADDFCPGNDHTLFPATEDVEELIGFSDTKTTYNAKVRVPVGVPVKGTDEPYTNLTMFLFRSEQMLPAAELDASKGTVVFDSNIPGADAKVEYLQNAGTTVTPPAVSSKTVGNVTFKFKGWYDQPVGGNKIGSTVTVPKGQYIVYYAQWDLVDNTPPGGDNGHGDMYLVYFDYNYVGGGVTAAYSAAGTFTWTVTDADGNEQEFSAQLPFGFPDNPSRPGYTFIGWGETAISTTPVSGAWRPTKTDTLFAIWQADQHNLAWNANGGTGGATTSQKYDEVILAPTTAPKRTGYTFAGWHQDANCTIPLTDGTTVTKDQTFWAKWTANEYEITWNADYTGGTISTTQQDYDEELAIMADPVREGWQFAGWYTGRNGAGTRADAYGKIRGSETFYANWTQDIVDYAVTLDWIDQSDNDAVRPDSVLVELLRNGTNTGYTHLFTAADAAEANKWEFTFTDLEATDPVSNAYKYSIAIKSSVPTEYEYKGDYTAQTAGYIMMTHKLITIDVDSYIVWDDTHDQDGYRPTQVTLQLLADGAPINDATTTVVVPMGSGDTWTHTFDAMQRYRRTDAGREDIAYTIAVTETVPGNLTKYTISYTGGHNQNLVATLTHQIDTVTKKAVVEWNDNNNQDNKRPSSMSVQLYADGEPVAGKHVTLSAANDWSYEWAGLPKYTAVGKQIVYSAQVTSMLTEYTAKSTLTVSDIRKCRSFCNRSNVNRVVVTSEWTIALLPPSSEVTARIKKKAHTADRTEQLQGRIDKCSHEKNCVYWIFTCRMRRIATP